MAKQRSVNKTTQVIIRHGDYTKKAIRELVRPHAHRFLSPGDRRMFCDTLRAALLKRSMTEDEFYQMVRQWVTAPNWP